MGKNQTGHCPVCGSTLDRITRGAMENVRRENIRKKDGSDRSYREVKS